MSESLAQNQKQQKGRRGSLGAKTGKGYNKVGMALRGGEPAEGQPQNPCCMEWVGRGVSAYCTPHGAPAYHVSFRSF